MQPTLQMVRDAYAQSGLTPISGNYLALREGPEGPGTQACGCAIGALYFAAHPEVPRRPGRALDAAIDDWRQKRNLMYPFLNGFDDGRWFGAANSEHIGSPGYLEGFQIGRAIFAEFGMGPRE